MGIIQTIKNYFRKGGYALQGHKLNTIIDHPKINIDSNELDRIDRDFREYRNEYSKIEYVNSNNQIKKREYVALNMRKLTGQMLSSLTFNEQVEIHIDSDSANEFMQHVFEHNDFKKNLAKYLEPMFVAGGLAVRPYVDLGSGDIEFSWALADAFYPLRSTSNGISEGVIVFKSVDTEKDKNVYYTLLEFHEWDNNDITIANELYRSENSTIIGERVPLGFNGQYEGLEEKATLTNMTRPLFNYLKPSGFNNFSLYSPLGIGVCDNSTSTLKQINDTYDQFNWEILMGQRTVIVSDHMLNYYEDEQSKRIEPVFDPNINVFKPLPMDSNSELIKDVTNDIRTEQYISAINQFFKTLEMEMQLSVGTFSFDGKSVKTATEVVSENSLTYRTRNMHCGEIEKFIKGLIISTLEIAKATIFDGKTLYAGEIPTFEQISVDFDDGVFTDKNAQLDYMTKAVVGQLMPHVEAIKRQFGLTDEQAAKWYKLIQAETTGLDVTEIMNKNEEEQFGLEE